MKITVLDRFSLGEDTPFDKLYELGEVTYYDRTPAELVVERLKGSDVVVINKVKMTRDIIASAKDLKLICVFATGFDNVDLDAAREYGVAVCNVPAYSTESVCLFTVATVLSLITHLPEYNRFVKSGDYTASGVPNRLTPVYHEISGKTWGIIGYGNIGKAVGKVAESFGAKVIVNKRNPVCGVECVDIETLCRESDIITVHCPLNNESRNLIDKDKLALMKKGVILVNEARGAVVSESDVTEALLSGKLGGFGCDVYSAEPMPKDHPYNKIMHLDNCLLTPHSAWGSYEARVRCINVICENIKSYLEGKTLNRVDIIGQN